MQLLQAVTSIVAGIGLGLIYDLFRIIRKQCKGRIVPQLLDLIFSAIVLSVLFYVMQYVGEGVFRLFMILAAVLGAILYFTGPSIWICWGLEKIADGIRKVLELLGKPLKLLKKRMKKIFKIFRKPLSKIKEME